MHLHMLSHNLILIKYDMVDSVESELHSKCIAKNQQTNIRFVLSLEIEFVRKLFVNRTLCD